MSCYLKGHTGRCAGAERSSIRCFPLVNNNRSWTTTFQDDDNYNTKDKYLVILERRSRKSVVSEEKNHSKNRSPTETLGDDDNYPSGRF